MVRKERFKLEQKVRDSIDVKRESEINEQANFKKLAQRWLEIKAPSVEPNTLYRDKRLLEMMKRLYSLLNQIDNQPTISRRIRAP